jgi:uncharacterized protein YdhG (YjbR/CyaY superfamily)
MVQSKVTTVKDYLAQLPEDRRGAIQAVRDVILKNLDHEFEEGMQYGMIGYYVPHSVYPPGYHCDPRQPLGFACLASQKNHMALYLMCVYADQDQRKRFEAEWKKAGKKLDMGKSCIRFKKLDDLALGVIGETIRRVTARSTSTSASGRLARGRRPPSRRCRPLARRLSRRLRRRRGRQQRDLSGWPSAKSVRAFLPACRLDQCTACMAE